MARHTIGGVKPSASDLPLGGEGEPPKKKRLRWLKIALLVTLPLVLIGLVTAFMWAKSFEAEFAMDPEEAAEVAEVTEVPMSGEPMSILLVGTDERAEGEQARADSIIFLYTNPDHDRSYMISVQRDTRVNIPGRGMDKVNHAYAYGAAPLLVETISELFAIEVNYVMKVDFESLEQVVDALGGVKFETDRTCMDWELDTEVRKGDLLRPGREALAIVRCRRAYADGDFSRMANQQAMIGAIAAKMASQPTSLPKVAKIIAEHGSTNMKLGAMIGTGRAVLATRDNIEKGKIPTRGTKISGVYYGVYDQDELDDIVDAMRNGLPLPEHSTTGD